MRENPHIDPDYRRRIERQLFWQQNGKPIVVGVVFGLVLGLGFAWVLVKTVRMLLNGR